MNLFSRLVYIILNQISNCMNRKLKIVAMSDSHDAHGQIDISTLP